MDNERCRPKAGRRMAEERLCPTGPHRLDGGRFKRRFRLLIALSWAVPPVFGLSFLLFVVELFTPEQLWLALLAPPLPLYIVGAQLFADVYFLWFARPIVKYLDEPTPGAEMTALARARSFPLHFWPTFLAYLLLAPVSVMASAYLGYGFVPDPVDWFRTELTSLVVSIIVGLPIFFLVIDLFGRAFRDVDLIRPHVSLGMKMFLAGALVPLLIDTMIVQYYWTSTGYFTWGTFAVWLVLEALAVVGALMLVGSLRQSLSPLADMMGSVPEAVDYRTLKPMSTDELGVLSSGYRKLLRGLQQQRAELEVRNELLRPGASLDVAQVVELVLQVSRDATDVCTAIALLDGNKTHLVVVAYADSPYQPDGCFHFSRKTARPWWSAVDAQAAAAFAALADAELVVDDLNCGSTIAAPLVAEGQVFGIVAGYAMEHRSWPSSTVSVLEAVAMEAGRLIHAATLRERQRDLETQLQHAQRMEGVGRLAGGVAHDFNNILTAIIGIASLQREDNPSAEHDAAFKEILKCSDRAAGLTHQLLAFSRHQMMEPKVIDLNDVVRDLESMLRRLIPSRISFDIELADELRSVFADRGQIEQVLVNLVINAKDAIVEQGRIVVRTENRKGIITGRVPTGEWVALIVQDNGTGVPEDIRDTIFEPYFTTKAAGKGTGLGLATVEGIVSQTGGNVALDAEYKEGARFEVLLPHDPSERQTVESRLLQPLDLKRLPGLSAAVVDDDPILRRVVSQTLRRHGIHVRAFGQGDDALAFVTGPEGAIDLLVTDVVMPGLSGTRVARQLAAVRPEAKVLIMSGYADTETLDNIQRAGFPFIAKPFTPEDLIRRVVGILAPAPV